MEEQWRVICYLAELFEQNNIEYQFDASTSAFIHGVGFEMDDIDVCILKKYEENVKQLLAEYEQTDIQIYNNSMDYFFVQIQNQKVHVMFPYFKTDCIDETRDILHNGVKIHTKTLEFYRRHLKEETPLAPLIDNVLKKMTI